MGVLAPGSAHFDPPLGPPSTPEFVLGAHVWGGRAKVSEKFLINFHAKFQNPRTTHSRRKVIQGEREKERENKQEPA